MNECSKMNAELSAYQRRRYGEYYLAFRCDKYNRLTVIAVWVYCFQ